MNRISNDNNSLEFLRQLPLFSEFIGVAQTYSMIPLIEPDDILTIYKAPYDEVKTSDIVAFENAKHQLLIAHRVTKIINTNSEKKLRTRGDSLMAEDSTILTKNNYLGKVIKIKNKRGFISLEDPRKNLFKYHFFPDSFYGISLFKILEYKIKRIIKRLIYFQI